MLHPDILYDLALERNRDFLREAQQRQMLALHRPAPRQRLAAWFRELGHQPASRPAGGRRPSAQL